MTLIRLLRSLLLTHPDGVRARHRQLHDRTCPAPETRPTSWHESVRQAGWATSCKLQQVRAGQVTLQGCRPFPHRILRSKSLSLVRIRTDLDETRRRWEAPATAHQPSLIAHQPSSISHRRPSGSLKVQHDRELRVRQEPIMGRPVAVCPPTAIHPAPSR
ncbi:hypothetical protein LZ31DRAFT_348483 [Colletotrichum somersetense]|nr:hypothetical protein LZ31DRAFT_348483 [Colletotrichum somersetense]